MGDEFLTDEEALKLALAYTKGGELESALKWAREIRIGEAMLKAVLDGNAAMYHEAGELGFCLTDQGREAAEHGKTGTVWDHHMANLKSG